MAFWSAVSLLADLDVIGFAFGVPYAAPWGHRGATHSLAVAALVGLTAAVLARRFDRAPAPTGLLAAGVMASHGLLDTMTDGGLGCALLWPFDLTRYFAPWRPIPVAPIGFAFLSPGGLLIALTELVLFLPLFALALPVGTPRRRLLGRTGLAAWGVMVWLIASADPVREAAIGAIVREDTAYSSGFSERAFRTVARGDSESDVLRALGPPHRQNWFYSPPGQPRQRAADTAASDLQGQCLTAAFEQDALTSALDLHTCGRRGIVHGMSPPEVRRVLGAPDESCWSFTWSPGQRRHRVRMVCFVAGRVDTVVRQWN